MSEAHFNPSSLMKHICLIRSQISLIKGERTFSKAQHGSSIIQTSSRSCLDATNWIDSRGGRYEQKFISWYFSLNHLYSEDTGPIAHTKYITQGPHTKRSLSGDIDIISLYSLQMRCKLPFLMAKCELS